MPGFGNRHHGGAEVRKPRLSGNPCPVPSHPAPPALSEEEEGRRGRGRTWPDPTFPVPWLPCFSGP